MTHSELISRLELTIECPPCPIEWTRRNGFIWYDEKNGITMTIGVAAALVGMENENSFHKRENGLSIPVDGPQLPANGRPCILDRLYRADLLGWEWSYLMHFEMAINSLFDGDLAGYNHTGYFPFVASGIIIPKNNFKSIKQVFSLYAPH